MFVTQRASSTTFSRLILSAAFITFVSAISTVASSTTADASAKEKPSMEKTIEAATKAYAAKEYSKAKAELQTAIDIITGHQRDVIRKFLPAAPEGYTSEEFEPPNLQALFGQRPLGTSVVQRYTHAESGQSFLVTINADSPQFKQVFEMLKSPSQQRPGTYTKEVAKDFEAIVTNNDRQKEMKVMVAEDILVSVQAMPINSGAGNPMQQGEAPKYSEKIMDVLLATVESMDLVKLKEAMKS